MDEQARTTSERFAVALVEGTSVLVDLVWLEPDRNTGRQTITAVLPMTDERLREHWRRGGLEPKTYELAITVDADAGERVDWAADLLVTDVVADMRRDYHRALLARQQPREKLPGGQDAAEFFRDEGFGHPLDN